jgi:protein arginine kinase activator
VKCDRCDNEATVHELRVENNVRREKHLCDQCARAEGITPQVPTPITSLLTQFVTQQGTPSGTAQPAAQPAVGGKLTCPGCGLGYAQFRQSGILGCERCYEAFEGQLTPLIARAHEGGTHHLGKTPKSRPQPQAGAAVLQAPPPVAPKPDPRALAAQVALLRKRLSEAVAAEQYEQAARLRDELAALQANVQPGEAPAPPAKRKPKGPDSDKPGPGHRTGGHQ